MNCEETRGATWLTVLSDPARLHVLRALGETTEASAAELSAATNISESTMRKQLDWLTEADIVREHQTERDGVTLGRPAARFSLDPIVRANVRELLESLGRSIFETSR